MKSNTPSKWERFSMELQETLSSKESNLTPKWKRFSRVVMIVLFWVILAGYIIAEIDLWYRNSAFDPIPYGEAIGIIIVLTSFTILVIYLVTVEYIFHQRRSLLSDQSEEPPLGK